MFTSFDNPADVTIGGCLQTKIVQFLMQLASAWSEHDLGWGSPRPATYQYFNIIINVDQLNVTQLIFSLTYISLSKASQPLASSSPFFPYFFLMPLLSVKNLSITLNVSSTYQINKVIFSNLISCSFFWHKSTVVQGLLFSYYSTFALKA